MINLANKQILILRKYKCVGNIYEQMKMLGMVSIDIVIICHYQRSSMMVRPMNVQSTPLTSSDLALGLPGTNSYRSTSNSGSVSHNLGNGNNDNNSPSSSGGSSSITALQTKMAAHRKYAALGKTRPNDSASSSGLYYISFISYFCLLF